MTETVKYYITQPQRLSYFGTRLVAAHGILTFQVLCTVYYLPTIALMTSVAAATAFVYTDYFFANASPRSGPNRHVTLALR